MINDPCKLNIFPNYLIGNLKSVYLINNEKYIGEGIGILIGQDVVLTSAHNLIFSQLEDGNIINYKPHSISFHLLANGYLDILEPNNCEINTIIYSDYFKDFKFIENQEINNSCIIKSKEISQRKNTVIFKKDENIIDRSMLSNNNNNQNDYKSKSSDYTCYKNNLRSLSKKLNINNISEIPLEEDYAIVFTEVNLGSEIINLFCDKDAKLYNDLINIDEESKIFKVFENHINFINELENCDSNKFQNSKISMISSIKYTSNLLGVSQYVYGSHLNDLNNKFYKSKKQKDLLKSENNKSASKINLTENKYFYHSPVSSYDYLREDNDFENSRITMKNRKWEKEFTYCLFINYDKNSNKKHLRNAHFDNLKKLMKFNSEEFYSEGKLIQCEARGKLCSLLFEKLRKTSGNKDFNNVNNPRYEVNTEKTTPYFNRQNRENEEKSNKDDSINLSENKINLSFYDLNSDLANKNISNFYDLSCPEILEDFDLNDNNVNGKGDIIYNKIFKQKIEEILRYSFSEKNDFELNEKKNIEKIQYLKNDANPNESFNKKDMSSKQSFIDEFIIKNLHSNYNQIKLNQMKDLYLSNQDRSGFSGLRLKGKITILNFFNFQDSSNHDASTNFSQIFQLNFNNNQKKSNDESVKKELNYMITTYKGQSGSPLFIRIKNEKLIEMKRDDLINCVNDKYSFIFLGLHSRSPEYFEPINRPKYQNGFFKNNNINNEIKPKVPEKINDENSSIHNKQKIINININLNEEFKDLNININLNTLIEKHRDFSFINNKDPPGNIINKFNEPYLKKDLMINEFLNKNNYCSYNVGLKIDKEILNKIKKSIVNKRSKKNFQFTKGVEEKEIEIPNDDHKKYYSNEKSQILNYNESSYMLINIHIYDEYLVKGIFNVTSYMKVLFEMASEYLEVDKKYILININDEFFESDDCGNEFILRYFEQKGIINKNFDDNYKKEDNNNKRVFREIINAFFVINIDKYSDFIKEKLFSKLRDNIRNFDDNEIYNNSENGNLKIIVRYIFNEIQNFFEKSQTLYGLLFSAIKTKMIKSS